MLWSNPPPNIEIVGVVTNRSDSEILNRARRHHIPCYYQQSSKSESPESYETRILPILQQWDPDYIFLSGYMRRVSPVLIDRYPIFNIHPSLLPRHGGKMDLAVHQSVLDSGDHQTGCTIHRIDHEFDTGPIVYQAQTLVAETVTEATALKPLVQELESKAWVDFAHYIRYGHVDSWINPSCSYSDSGVSVVDNDTWVDSLKSSLTPSIGDFCAIVPSHDMSHSVAAATDGVGTKLLLAHEAIHYYWMGIDLVAMCANDLLVRDCQPCYFLDYLAIPSISDTPTLRDNFLKGIVEGCRQASSPGIQCRLIGGETAELPDLYRHGHWDAAGFAIGIPPTPPIHPTIPEPNRYFIVGVPSNGIHANGFSLVRKILRRYRSPYPIEDWLQPTRIYSDTLQSLKNFYPEVVSNGHLAHITGGGLVGNLQRLYTQSTYKPTADNFSLSVAKMPRLFQWLARHGPVTHREMLHTFNCGYGLVYLLPYDKSESLSSLMPTHQIIGNC